MTKDEVADLVARAVESRGEADTVTAWEAIGQLDADAETLCGLARILVKKDLGHEGPYNDPESYYRIRRVLIQLRPLVIDTNSRLSLASFAASGHTQTMAT